MSETQFTIGDDNKALTIERTFNAAKNKVWSAYTSAEDLAKWWGPTGWETEVKHLDFSEGGYWLYVMRCVDKNQAEWFGKTSAGKAVYSSIDPQDSFEYVDYFSDEEGNVNQEMPSANVVIAFHENEDGTTTLTSKIRYETEDQLKQVLEMGMKEGFQQTLDKLDEFVTK